MFRISAKAGSPMSLFCHERQFLIGCRCPRIRARFAAATALLDRGYGRPAQSLDLHASHAATLPEQPRQMIGERLAGRPLALERLHRLRPGRRILGRQDPSRSQGAITAGTVLGTRKATVLRAGRYRCQCERVVIAAPDRREGIDLSVSTLADQVGACTTALRALHALIERHVLAAAERQARMITTPATPALEGTAQGRARLLERRHVVAGWRIATLFHRLLHCAARAPLARAAGALLLSRPLPG